MSWLSGIEMAADRVNHSDELPVPGDQVSETGPLSLMLQAWWGDQELPHPKPLDADGGDKGTCELLICFLQSSHF